MHYVYAVAEEVIFFFFVFLLFTSVFMLYGGEITADDGDNEIMENFRKLSKLNFRKFDNKFPEISQLTTLLSRMEKPIIFRITSTVMINLDV